MTPDSVGVYRVKEIMKPAATAVEKQIEVIMEVPGKGLFHAPDVVKSELPQRFHIQFREMLETGVIRDRFQAIRKADGQSDKQNFSGPGLVVAGVDSSVWKQLPDRILSSMSQEKRFSLELVFWAKREIRNGDKFYDEYFLVPLHGESPEEAAKTFCSLAGGN